MFPKSRTTVDLVFRPDSPGAFESMIQTPREWAKKQRNM